MVDQGRGAPAPLEAEIRITMGPAGMSGIPYQAFMDDELVAVASPKLVSEKGNPERPEALTGFTLIHDRDPYTAWGRWFSAFLPNMVPPAHGPRFTSADLVLRAAEAGRGVALSRKRLVEDDLRDGRLVRVLAQYALPLPNAYLLAVPSGKNANPAILSVRNWLYEEAAREDPV